jgi:hypothetical protein
LTAGHDPAVWQPTARLDPPLRPSTIRVHPSLENNLDAAVAEDATSGADSPLRAPPVSAVGT